MYQRRILQRIEPLKTMKRNFFLSQCERIPLSTSDSYGLLNVLKVKMKKVLLQALSLKRVHSKYTYECRINVK